MNRWDVCRVSMNGDNINGLNPFGVFRHFSWTMKSLLFLLLLASVPKIHAELPVCKPTDFHYEYTECDSNGGRWRVAIPTPDTCKGGEVPFPVRGKSCGFTCSPGNYLDIDSESQDCKSCPAGTYSLGGGMLYDNWDHIPKGFSVSLETFHIARYFGSSRFGGQQSNQSCASAKWKATGKYLSSMAGDCTAILMYTANLVKAGYVMFEYQYTDESSIFEFLVQNDKCHNVKYDDDHVHWPPKTGDSKWGTAKLKLQPGRNLIYWKTLSLQLAGRLQAQTLIRKIEIKGVAYTSECSKCRPGTYSGVGMTGCTECPRNTHSQRGASQCIKCDDTTEYSMAGAKKCSPRPPCTIQDYFATNTPCDLNDMTHVEYKWVEPKLCRDDLPKSAKLPAPSASAKCPPCNPGMQPVNGSCQFCPRNKYSDGTGQCKTCPVSTAPTTELTFNWWNNLPSNANLTSHCLSSTDDDYIEFDGWLRGIECIHTGKGFPDNAYLILMLDVDGFHGHQQMTSVQLQPVGEVTFVFEAECAANCSFIFMDQSTSSNIVKRWVGSQTKQKYVHKMMSSEATTFSWAFQKKDSGDPEHNQVKLHNDFAKIYSVVVTNTLSGGAASCKACPKGVNQDGCVQCPPGQYLDTNTTQCVRCPAGTVIHGQGAHGAKSCVKCGEGLHAVNGVKCVTSCHYTSPSGRKYDFTHLASVYQVNSGKLFTSTGTQFHHMFNLSLCGGATNHPPVTCHNNISASSDSDDTVTSLVCRLTIIPPSAEDGLSKMVTVQSVSLGDVLVNITSNGSSLNMEQMMASEGFSKDTEDLDVHFVYVAQRPTEACPSGRSTVITVRCDTSQPGNGTIELPPKCMDGTCDGCRFHLLWRSAIACPQCTDHEYTAIKGECHNSVQRVFYQHAKHCPERKEDKLHCTSLPLWVLQLLGGAIAVAVIMCGVLIYCWKKNQKLEYKYMKLVVSSSGDLELPAAETCALDNEEEDEEQCDRIHFKQKGKFFSRLKSIATNKKLDENPFENISLSEKSPLT